MRTPTSPPDPVIESQFVPVALAYAAAMAAAAPAPAIVAGDVAAIRAELVPGEIPDSGTIPLSLARIRECSERIATALGDPHLGLTIASRVPRGIGGVGELAARSAPTIGAALERCARYSRIITPHQELMCTRDDASHELRFSYRVPGGVPPFAGRHTNEYAVAVFRRLADEMSGAHPPLRRVWLAHGDEAKTRARLAEYFELPATAIEFDRDSNGLAFDLSLADQPIPAADPTLLRVLEQYAQSLMPAEDAAPELLRNVERAVAELLVDGVPTLASVAQRMAVGERTLQRHLRAEGTTFAELVEKIRRALAEQHLRRRTLSVSEVAYVLGYSDGRAFARAFHRWFGLTPTEFRARSA